MNYAQSAERAVRDMRRKTWRRFSGDEESWTGLEGLRGPG